MLGCFHTRWRLINKTPPKPFGTRYQTATFEDKCLSMFETWIEAVCRSLLTRCQTEDAKWLSREHTLARFLIGWRRCASEPACTPWRFSLAKLNVYARAANWGIEYSYGSNPLSRKGEFNYAWLPGSNPLRRPRPLSPRASSSTRVFPLRSPLHRSFIHLLSSPSP